MVDDQVGRLTFADDLTRATRHLLDTGAAYGTYHCTHAGPPTSWADVARRVFELSGRDPDDVTPVSSEEYAAGQDLAPRPRSSTIEPGQARGHRVRPGGRRGTRSRDYLAQAPQRS